MFVCVVGNQQDLFYLLCIVLFVLATLCWHGKCKINMRHWGTLDCDADNKPGSLLPYVVRSPKVPVLRFSADNAKPLYIYTHILYAYMPISCCRCCCSTAANVVVVAALFLEVSSQLCHRQTSFPAGKVNKVWRNPFELCASI